MSGNETSTVRAHPSREEITAALRRWMAGERVSGSEAFAVTCANEINRTALRQRLAIAFCFNKVTECEAKP